jgi:DNA phosphorothioation-dependent restriction protein DptH
VNRQTILVGEDIKSRLPIGWNPASDTGSPNPHMMIVGESGSGKTYAVQCLVAELIQNGMSAVIFDYAQGFVENALPHSFVRTVRPREILASTRGLNVNPMRIAPTDANGPVNAAVRVSDTFARIYRIGVQQHSLLRDVILDTFQRVGISRDRPRSWQLTPPTLADVHSMLVDYSEDKENSASRIAYTLRSHLSSFFVFDTFRRDGEILAWETLFKGFPQCHVVQLDGLEDKTEKVVTEFLLWDLFNYVRSVGPQELRAFCVLDEAHKLSFAENSPVDKLLREARKFGLGLMLASQQPEDFSAVAHANTAAKLIFHTTDRRALLTKPLAQRFPSLGKPDQVASLVGQLQRGRALYYHQSQFHVVNITSFDDRAKLRYRLNQISSG